MNKAKKNLHLFSPSCRYEVASLFLLFSHLGPDGLDRLLALRSLILVIV